MFFLTEHITLYVLGAFLQRTVLCETLRDLGEAEEFSSAACKYEPTGIINGIIDGIASPIAAVDDPSYGDSA